MSSIDKIEAILNAAQEVLGDSEGPRTPAQAHLCLALYDYDPKRFFIGTKEMCECDDKEDCDECMTNEEAIAACRALAAKDQNAIPRFLNKLEEEGKR